MTDNDDDGETAAGGRLAHLLQILVSFARIFYYTVLMSPDATGRQQHTSNRYPLLRRYSPWPGPLQAHKPGREKCPGAGRIYGYGGEPQEAQCPWPQTIIMVHIVAQRWNVCLHTEENKILETSHGVGMMDCVLCALFGGLPRLAGPSRVCARGDSNPCAWMSDGGFRADARGRRPISGEVICTQAMSHRCLR